jgi:hypothetical protein
MSDNREQSLKNSLQQLEERTNTRGLSKALTRSG